MASVQDIIDAVTLTTRRYDRPEFIESRVKMAIKHIHSQDHFPLDRVEVVIPYVDLTLIKNDTVGQFQIPPYWKIFEVIRPQNSAGVDIAKKFTSVSPMEIEKLKTLGKDANTYYVAGQLVNFKCSDSVYQLVCTYYRVPNLTPGTGQTLADLSTWLTDSWEEAIHDYACFLVYSMIGEQEISRTYKNTYDTIWYPDIQRSHAYQHVNR